MEKIRVGVVGPGRIVRRVMKDFYKAQSVELTAIASRNYERAKEAAAEYGAKYAFGSYEELAACSDVDLVYIATPHPFHCEQALLMMNSGKHVICEKPIAITEDETRRMSECAKKNGVFLMEAMWTRFFPATKKMKALIEAGKSARSSIFTRCSAAAAIRLIPKAECSIRRWPAARCWISACIR